MKFAIAALIAATSAITIKSAVSQSCVTEENANESYDSLDTNHNGKLSWTEIVVGLSYLAGKFNHTITDADKTWIRATYAVIDPKNPGVYSRAEFREFSRLLFKHWGLCAKIEEMDSDIRTGGGCVNHQQAMDAFHHLDTDHSDSLSYSEIVVGLYDLADDVNHTITEADKTWI